MHSSNHPSHAWQRYAVVVGIVALSTVMRIWPLGMIGASNAWLTYYPAVAVAVLIGGFRAGLLATILACISVTFLWPSLVVAPFIRGTEDWFGMGVFVLTCTLISIVAEAKHREILRAERAKHEAETLAQSAVARAHFIKFITDAIPGMVAYWDSDLHCRYANQRYLDWFDKLPEELIGKLSLKDLLGEKLFALNQPYILRTFAGVSQQFERTLTKQDGTNSYTWVNYIPHIGAYGAAVGFFVLVTDVTPLKAAEIELELAASVYLSIDDGILVTDANAVILSVNPAFTNITGYAAVEAIGQTPSLLQSNRHDEAFFAAMWRAISDSDRWEGEVWNRRKNGEVYPARMTITVTRDSAGAVLRYVAVFKDITDRWRMDEHIRHLAFHDALTDLPNRLLLMELLGHQIAMSEREKRQLAVIFVDLDGFKAVNDTLGHVFGDDVLKTVAKKIRSSIRQTDTVARVGGDEFIIMMNNPENREKVAQIADLVIAAVNEPIICGHKTARVGVSVGIAMFPGDGKTQADLISSADTAMYAAKNCGKNTYRFFESTMDVREC